MGSPWGRKLRPLAVLCALLLVAWGLASAGALVAQIRDLNEYGWPDDRADGEIWTWTLLYLSAAASGCWVGIWGLFGLAWRPPLHFGAVALVVAVGLEVAGNLVQADYIAGFDPAYSFGDQLEWYGDRVTFDAAGLTDDQATSAFFIALPLVTAVLPFVAWLVVLFSGAGRPRRAPQPGSAYPQPYPQQYPQPYPQQYPQPYAAPPVQQYPPQQAYQAPYQAPYQPPPVQEPPPVQAQPREPRVAWQQVPPVVPPARPTPRRTDPPDQQDTLPYQNRPPGG